MTTSMSAILADVGLIVTAATGWMGSFVDFITENPICLLAIILPVSGIAIGFIKRLLNL